MSIRPRNATSGSIICDTKTFTGRCGNEFEGLDNEPYLDCMARAEKEGWIQGEMHLHLCPEHAWLHTGRRKNSPYSENPHLKGRPMSEFEALHAELAANLDKRKALVRTIAEMEKLLIREEIDIDVAVDQITDWKFDLFILHKEANRIMRKMFKVDPHQAAELEDLSTD